VTLEGWIWLTLAVVVGLPGLGLFIVGLRAWLLPEPHRRFLGFRPLLAWAVRRRLGGYKLAYNQPDPRLPTHPDKAIRVAVVGGGLAGLGAASILGERGVHVTVYESNIYPGGKIGAWPVTFGDGGTEVLEHGFHAFFRHYWNLRRFLTEKLKVYQDFRAIEEYVIVRPDGTRLGFGGLETTPALNIIALSFAGVFDWRAILRNPASSKRMEHLLRYDPATTPEVWDDSSFAEFADKAGLAPDLALSFTTFSRAFFADPDKMSMGELIKSFHFYYLSHDEGLEYDFPVKDYHRGLLEPWVAWLEKHGVDLRLASPVRRVDRKDGGFEVDGAWYDEVILACHLPGAQAIVEASPDLALADPDLARRLATLRTGQRYAVLRLWMTADIPADLPMFVITDRVRLLDSVTTYHRFEEASRRWVAENPGGSVLELHCYAVPDDLPDQAAIRAAMLDDLYTFWPHLRQATLLREHCQVRQDFPAFHRGLFRHRPAIETAVPGLCLAGDWVKLPFPAMLMEGAFTSGVLAANVVLRRHGLREELVEHVPLKGLLAGVPGGEIPG
jgi:isorenieratene synthase